MLRAGPGAEWGRRAEELPAGWEGLQEQGVAGKGGAGDVPCVPERPMKMKPKSPQSLATWRLRHLPMGCVLEGCFEWVEERGQRDAQGAEGCAGGRGMWGHAWGGWGRRLSQW